MNLIIKSSEYESKDIMKPKKSLLWSKNSLEDGRARREKTSYKVII